MTLPDEPGGFRPNPRFVRIYQAKAVGDVATLIDALADPDFRMPAARYLGDLGATEAIPAVMRLLRANDPATRATAAKVLGRLRATDAVPDLIEVALNDPIGPTRSYAITALGLIADSRAKTALESILADDDEVQLRRLAATALSSLGTSESIALLRTAGKRESVIHRRRYRQAARAISRRMGGS